MSPCAEPAQERAKELTGLTPAEATSKALAWLNGFQVDEASLWDASKVRLQDDSDPDAPSRDSILVLQHLYREHELITINTRYIVAPKKDGEKVTIIGPGETKTAAQWVEHIKAHGNPQSRAGSWMRINPVSRVYGSGAGGAHCDSDVASFRYLLLESDLLEPAVALNVYGKLAYPIAAIIDSAGRGPHAWLTINSHSAEEYADEARFVFSLLDKLGFDSNNSNPSRYSRLAGAKRVIGAREGMDGFQRLLYLAPHLKPNGIFS
jgi:hypothetical protein